MSELVLEAGKTYVFKDEESRKAYIRRGTNNIFYVKSMYKGGFKIERISSFRGGYIGSVYVIGSGELEYFKLKEENDMKEFTKDMLKDGMVVKFRGQDSLMSKGKHLVLCNKLINNTGSVDLGDFTDNLKCIANTVFDVMRVYKVLDSNILDIECWKLELIWERKELTEQQKKILELEETINKAQEQIKQLKGE